MSFRDYFNSPIKMTNSFFSPEKPYESAEDAMRKYWDEARGYMTPYNTAGVNQIPSLTNAENSLLNPAKLQGEWAKTYETSPEAIDLMKRSTDIGNQEASSMGLAGSSANLENIQRTGASIVSQDRQRYLQNLMDKYMAGIGIGQNMYNVGAGTASNLGQGAVNVGRDMGGIAYGRTAAPGERLGQIIGAGAGYMGGGAGGASTLR